MSLLTERLRLFVKRFPGTIHGAPMRDPYGPYAYQVKRPNGREYYFCAKMKTAGTIISVHASLLEAALIYGRQIIMAIGYDFYLYDPREVRRLELFRNQRNGATMVNFNMEIGTPLNQDTRVPTGRPRPTPPADPPEDTNLVEALRKNFGAEPVPAHQ